MRKSLLGLCASVGLLGLFYSVGAAHADAVNTTLPYGLWFVIAVIAIVLALVGWLILRWAHQHRKQG
jgi:H+/Cl- antiporter ClcA